MNRTQGRSGAAGFTLLEVLIILALIAIMVAIGVPSLQRYVYQGRIEGIARQTAMLMNRARMEAVRRGVPVVVRADYDSDQIIAFTDVNDSAGVPGSNLAYDPGAGTATGAADYEFARLTLPSKVWFWGANPAGSPDPSPEGANAVEGFTAQPTLTPNAAVFKANGSIAEQGAFRFGDGRGNFLEVRVAPTATARVRILKFNDDIAPDTVGADGKYHPPGKDPGTGGPMWVWH
jgi:type II secretory pathway pseudopilin PulG